MRAEEAVAPRRGRLRSRDGQLALDWGSRTGWGVNERDNRRGDRGCWDGLRVVNEHHVGGYRGNRIGFFADGFAKSEGIAVLEDDRDIGENWTRDDFVPSEQVRAMMGVKVDDVNVSR